MAITQTINMPMELRDQARKSIQRRDRFILGVVQAQRAPLSRRAKKRLTRASIVNSPQQGQGTLFRFLSPYWWQLTPEQRAYWRDCAIHSGLNGWQLFISDNAERIKNNLSFPFTPSTVWQVRVGQIKIEAPASSISIKQRHATFYQRADKVRGAPWKREIKNVSEYVAFPLQLSIRFRSDLIPFGSEQRCEFFARVWHKYQGEDYFVDHIIDLDPSSDWTTATISIPAPYGIYVGYDLWINVLGYRGTLEYDNPKSIHSNTNWALDPRCDDVSKIWTGAFSNVPPNWEAVDVPEGAEFKTIYGDL